MHKRDQWEHVWVLDGLSGGRGREETHNTYTLENSGGGVIIGVHCLLQYPTELSIGDWGEWLGHWKSSGCNMDNLWYYPNHTNLSAIVTTQHQWLNHPKKISVPLGQQSNAADALQTRTMLNRTNLLLISSSESETRTPIYNRIIANFDGTIKNRKGDESHDLQICALLAAWVWTVIETGKLSCWGLSLFLRRSIDKTGYSVHMNTCQSYGSTISTMSRQACC